MRCQNLLLLSIFLYSAVFTQAQVQAFLTTDQFWSPEKGHYVDVNISLVGSSLVYHENENGREQGKVAVLAMIEQDGNIVDFRKVDVMSPEILNSMKADMIHSERFALETGSYDLVLELQDQLNPNGEVASVKKPFVVADYSNRPAFSDIQLAETILPTEDDTDSRNGYRIVPYVSTYYPQELKDLRFYCELYNTKLSLGEDADLLITYTIKSYETASIYKNFRQVRRGKAQEIIPVIAEFNIADIPSGNYNLHIEVTDRAGNVIAEQKQFFQRNNPVGVDLNNLEQLETSGTFVDQITEVDTLLAFVDCLRPIASNLERKIIDDRQIDPNPELMRSFLYSFWFNRNPTEPERAWNSYLEEVISVNRKYGTRLKQGYQTDRGYVHLKYGPPSTLMDRPNENDAYPYQIWHYYKAGLYNNKRFVFYLPDLVTNDYTLLHSEVPGEIKEPRWNEHLHSRNDESFRELRQQENNTISKDRASDFFEIPR